MELAVSRMPLENQPLNFRVPCVCVCVPYGDVQANVDREVSAKHFVGEQLKSTEMKSIELETQLTLKFEQLTQALEAEKIQKEARERDIVALRADSEQKIAEMQFHLSELAPKRKEMQAAYEAMEFTAKERAAKLETMAEALAKVESELQNAEAKCEMQACLSHIINQNGATSGFEICFCYRIPAP